MAKFDFWNLKFEVDQLIYAVSNWGYRMKVLLKGQSKVLSNVTPLKNCASTAKATIILSGPSINKQDLRPLKDELLFFVNRGYKHPDYAYLAPQYHVIVDYKLSTGEWPISMLDDILDKNPDVTFILNAKWYHLEQFQPYKQKCKIYWISSELFFTKYFKRQIDLQKPMPGVAVFGACLNTLIYMGVQDIQFMGFDGNGLCYELIGASSHFYGVNDDKNVETNKDQIKSLQMMAHSLQSLIYVAKYCKQKNISVKNATYGGLLQMFDRVDYPHNLKE